MPRLNAPAAERPFGRPHHHLNPSGACLSGLIRHTGPTGRDYQPNGKPRGRPRKPRHELGADLSSMS
jgi:hypothetical protein